MKFYNYLKNSLNYPLCYTSKIFEIIFTSISFVLESVIEGSYVLLSEFFIKLTKNIQNYISERTVTMIPNESYAQFLSRAKNIFLFYKNIAYKKEIERLIKLITNKDFRIIQANIDQVYIGDFTIGEDYVGGAPFTYVLIFNDILTSEEKALVLNILKQYIRAYLMIYIISLAEYKEFYIGECVIGEIKI